MTQQSLYRRGLRLRRIPGTLFALIGFHTTAVQADLDQQIESALSPAGGQYGKFNFDLRWRYEYVDQDSPKSPDIGHASTARLRAGYLTPAYQGLQAFAEFEGLADVGTDDHKMTPTETSRFPLIADPEASEVNQLWLSYAGLPSTLIKAGRQRIVFDNHRFVGDVGWRQMQQTFDAVSVTSTLIPRTTATAAYLIGVQDIFSHYVKMHSPILNVSVDTGYGKLIGYGLWLDYHDPKDSKLYANSTQTYGVRFDGVMPVTDDIKTFYTFEYAHQEDFGKNPVKYRADYWMAEAGVNLYGVTLKGAIEDLGSDNGVGFTTPLSTLHAFQGWADLFLNTPKDGIRDLYGTVKYTVYGIDLMAVYHEFSDDTGGLDYGHEIDLQAEKKFGKHYGVLLKFADYSNAGFGREVLKLPDTQKFWLQGSVSF